MTGHSVCSSGAFIPETPVPVLDRWQLIMGNQMRALLLVFAVLCGPLLILGGCSDYAGPPVTAGNPNDSGGSGGGGSGGGGGGGGMGY